MQHPWSTCLASAYSTASKTLQAFKTHHETFERRESCKLPALGHVLSSVPWAGLTTNLQPQMNHCVRECICAHQCCMANIQACSATMPAACPELNQPCMFTCLGLLHGDVCMHASMLSDSFSLGDRTQVSTQLLCHSPSTLPCCAD